VGRDLESAYANADVLVLPSRGETYGMVISEALARGVPVIAAAVGGVPDALGRARDGRRPGLLVAGCDSSALAAAIRRWLAEPSLRADLRQAAALRRPDLPTWSKTAHQVAAVLVRVAA
jgi:glycosyltransferase involved in cell wall biosynthesis